MLELTDQWTGRINEPIGQRLLIEKYEDKDRKWTIRIRLDNGHYLVNGNDLAKILDIKDPPDFYSFGESMELTEDSNLKSEDKEYLNDWLHKAFLKLGKRKETKDIILDRYKIDSARYSWKSFKKHFNKISKTLDTLKKLLDPWNLMKLSDNLRDSAPLRHAGLGAVKFYEDEGKLSKSEDIQELNSELEDISSNLSYITYCSKNEIYSRDEDHYDYDATWNSLIGDIEKINEQIEKVDELDELAKQVVDHLKEA